MTIKEIESLSGMTRANIRYYEQEGLISPHRAPNGYRDYSEEDLAVLKRIKLLRSLRISLEEIKELQSGSTELVDTLAQKIAELEQVRQDAGYAQDVCRVMREDGATYSTLDAQKYLDGIPQQWNRDGYFSTATDTSPQVPYPWRRFFARTLDLAVYSTAWAALLAMGFRVNILARIGGAAGLFHNLVAALIMLFTEPLLLRLFGTTFGKWIFGLHLEDEYGRRPDYLAGLARTWGVIGAGLGYEIPIYSAIALWKSYKRFDENVPQPWDGELVYSIRDTKWYRGIAFVGAHGLLFGALTLAVLFAQLPPNRGDITVSQFAENYNAAADYYGIGRSRRLDAQGKWVDVSDGGTISMGFGLTPLPQFEYTVDNGYVTGIRFEISVHDSDDWLGFNSNEMKLAALGFVGAQADAGIFSKVRDRAIDSISANLFQDFAFTEAGVNVACRLEYSGYIPVSQGTGVLIPREGEKTSFSMRFSMKKAID